MCVCETHVKGVCRGTLSLRSGRAKRKVMVVKTTSDTYDSLLCSQVKPDTKLGVTASSWLRGKPQPRAERTAVLHTSQLVTKPLDVRTPRPRLPDDKHAEARPISSRSTEEETRRPGEEVSAGDHVSCERACGTRRAGGPRPREGRCKQTAWLEQKQEGTRAGLGERVPRMLSDGNLSGETNRAA